MFREIDQFYRWQRGQTLRSRAAIIFLTTTGILTLTLSATLIRFETRLEKVSRAAGCVISAVLCGVATAKSYRLIEEADDHAASDAARIDLISWKHAKLVEAATSQPVESENPALQPGLDFYDWQDAVDDAVGFIIAGNSGAGKSSTATFLAGLLTQKSPAQIFVLDPHYNDIWPQNKLHAIGDIEEIEAVLHLLIDELDKRCRLKGQRLPLGEPVIVITDEIGACQKRFSDPKFLKDSLERLGSEGRKFGLSLIAINQSSNVDDLGISAPLRANYLCIALNASARAIADKWKGEDARKTWIHSQAYSCVVFGSVPPQIAKHPTHSGYAKYRKNGNPPQGLLPIRQLPLTLINQGKGEPEIMDVPVWHHTPHATTHALNPGSDAVWSATAHTATHVFCPSCSSRDVKIHGSTSNGKKRYKCKACGKTFS